jgi:hypothetical protein
MDTPLFGIPDSLGENDPLFFAQIDFCGQHRSIDPIPDYGAQPKRSTE